MKFGERKTLDPLNQFAFVCPVFKAQTKIAACFMLRDLVWRGEKQPTRRGCQVAMHAGKCPINQIIKDMGRLDDDPYYSATVKVGTLRDDILDRIAPVLVPEGDIQRADLPTKETLALRACNEEAHDHAKNPIKKKHQRRRDPTQAEIDARAEPMPELTDSQRTIGKAAFEKISAVEGLTAAKSGDMTAALNAEIKDTGATP